MAISPEVLIIYFYCLAHIAQAVCRNDEEHIFVQHKEFFSLNSSEVALASVSVKVMLRRSYYEIGYDAGHAWDVSDHMNYDILQAFRENDTGDVDLAALALNFEIRNVQIC